MFKKYYLLLLLSLITSVSAMNAEEYQESFIFNMSQKDKLSIIKEVYLENSYIDTFFNVGNSFLVEKENDLSQKIGTVYFSCEQKPFEVRKKSYDVIDEDTFSEIGKVGREPSDYGDYTILSVNDLPESTINEKEVNILSNITTHVASASLFAGQYELLKQYVVPSLMKVVAEPYSDIIGSLATGAVLETTNTLKTFLLSKFLNR